jgi:hypothetical protein
VWLEIKICNLSVKCLLIKKSVVWQVDGHFADQYQTPYLVRNYVEYGVICNEKLFFFIESTYMGQVSILEGFKKRNNEKNGFHLGQMMDYVVLTEQFLAAFIANCLVKYSPNIYFEYPRTFIIVS